jgi:hypothetical protein
MTVAFVGQMVRMTFTVKDVTGAVANTTAVAKVESSATSTITTLSLSTSGTGIYYGDFTPTEVGAHDVRFTGTGAVVTAFQDSFTVVPQTIP